MNAARKLDLDAPVPFKLGPAALSLVARGRADDAALHQATVGATKKSGTMEAVAGPAAALRKVTRRLEAMLREMQVHADLERFGYEWTGAPEALAERQARLLERGRAALLAWEGFGGKPTSAPRMHFVEGLLFFARCEVRETAGRPAREQVIWEAPEAAHARPASPRRPPTPDEVEKARLRRARDVIDRLSITYPDVAALMDAELVADAIKAIVSRGLGEQRTVWKAIVAAWPLKIATDFPEKKLCAEWAKWKRERRGGADNTPAEDQKRKTRKS